MNRTTADAAATQALARHLGGKAFPGLFIALRGGLGAGKTVFVRGLAAGMGIAARVTSPSFAIVHEYAATPPLYHFDMYRLDVQRALDMGELEYFEGEGVCPLEWHERAEALLPPARLEVRMQGAGDQPRTIELRATDARHAALLEDLP